MTELSVLGDGGGRRTPVTAVHKTLSQRAR